MFRLGVIIRLFVEPCHRYIKYSAYFGIPKKFTFKDTGKIYLKMTPSSRNMSLYA